MKGWKEEARQLHYQQGMKKRAEEEERRERWMEAKGTPIYINE